MLFPFLLLLLAQAVAGQEGAPALKNEGKPIQTPFECTQNDIDEAGLTCTADEPCPVYLEISAFEAVGNRLFAAGNIHAAASTLYSILLSSDDAGSTWREPFERIRGAGFDHMQFVDFQNGWISGEALNPLPHDPFVLVTGDGGKSWRRVAIFDDEHGGTIQQLWFDSKKHGIMLIDDPADPPRYSLCESETGGDSWTIAESSDHPIRVKHAAAAPRDSGWRIRPDARSSAFHIEKRDGEGWSAVAAFAVPIGQCGQP